MHIVRILSVLALAGIYSINTGCEFESAGSEGGFNTSQGAGINLVFSGRYRPRAGSSEVVRGRGIVALTIVQSGNNLRVLDSNGSEYNGTVGSPGLIARPNVDTGAYPAGAELAQAQCEWTGVNRASGGQVEAVGVFHTVTVADIRGTTTSVALDTVDDNVNNVAFNSSTVVNDTNENSSETVTVIDAGSTTITISSLSSDSRVDDTESTLENQANQQNTTTGNTTDTSSYSVTEANTQIVLEGNWLESGGASVINGISSGTAGLIALGVSNSGSATDPLAAGG
jgi:hypothetical protein